jgi:hypothetical protein
MKSLILSILLFATGFAMADTIYSPSISGPGGEKTFKIIPTYGIMTLKTDYENINSEINAGVALEKMLSSRFSLGLLFNYAKFNFNDSNSNVYNNYPYNNNYGYNGYNNNGLNYNYYGQSIKSEIFSVGVNSKLFILNDGMLRPFLGGGLTYNRNNLSYDYNNSSYNYYNGYNGQYSANVNSFSGLLMAGTEFRFSQNIGLNFDFRYIKTLGNNSDYYYRSSFSNLDYLGRMMENSDLMSFNAGILIAI